MKKPAWFWMTGKRTAINLSMVQMLAIEEILPAQHNNPFPKSRWSVRAIMAGFSSMILGTFENIEEAQEFVSGVIEKGSIPGAEQIKEGDTDDAGYAVKHIRNRSKGHRS